MNPKISIIIPIYNASENIRKCVDSILAQTYKNYELILINDGSADDSGEICDQYSQLDKRIIVKHKTNGGVSSARNLGLDTASGEYVLFVDSDDWIESCTLETIKGKFDQSMSDVIIFGLVKHLVSDHGVIKSEFNGLYKNEKININDLANNFIYYLDSAGMQPSWMYAFKRNIISENKLRFNENLVLYEDFDFNIRYLGKCEYIEFISDALYHYEMSASIDQLRKRNKVNIVEDIGTVCQSIFNFLQDQKVSEEVLKQFYMYVLPMYTLCLKSILIHSRSTNFKQKAEILTQLQNDAIYNKVIDAYSDTLRFYKLLDRLIRRRFYRLAYLLIRYTFNE